jgi:DinB family protein
MERGEREALIERYAAGPARLRAALATVPPDARQWRPKAGEWSAHEVVCHCADSETNAYARIRFLMTEKDALIQGYDENRWAIALDYHAHPLEPALAVVDAVRANTVALIRRLPEEAWTRVGRHTESGRYRAEDWLRIYAEHLEGHARQIEDNVAQWRAVSRA